MTRRAPLLLPFLFLSACNRTPDREEALRILRTTNPAIDTATAIATVWRDGPPWFSCAEVIAKFKATSDSAAVRNRVGNWRALVLADWVTLRDTAAAHVVEPGWCAATLRDSTARLAGGWTPISGDSVPSGSMRRGWRVTTGHQRVVVKDAPKKVGRDSVMVNYLLTVSPNQNGVALQADRDSVQRSALFLREEGKWVVASWHR
ncbi:MAG: hypothetical protein JWL61_1897 [Gemmatimonadetes bacterium]|nr:hypothetical protein [Gemmatimonadota bacterium]